MKELKRLLVDSSRIKRIDSSNQLLSLKPRESHYLNRVLRLKVGEIFGVVDGIGHFWRASLQKNSFIRIDSINLCPEIDELINNNEVPSWLHS